MFTVVDLSKRLLIVEKYGAFTFLVISFFFLLFSLGCAISRVCFPLNDCRPISAIDQCLLSLRDIRKRIDGNIQCAISFIELTMIDSRISGFHFRLYSTVYLLERRENAIDAFTVV